MSNVNDNADDNADDNNDSNVNVNNIVNGLNRVVRTKVDRILPSRRRFRGVCMTIDVYNLQLE